MARDTDRLFDRERDRIKAAAGRLAKIQGLRLARKSQTTGEETRCWRRPRPPGHVTGSCKDLRVRFTLFRYESHTPWRSRPLVVSVKVADYHRQPPHPDPLEERIRKDQRRYQVVGWEVQE